MLFAASPYYRAAGVSSELTSQIAFVEGVIPGNVASKSLAAATLNANDIVIVCARSANGVTTLPTVPDGSWTIEGSQTIGTSLAAVIGWKMGSGISGTGTWGGTSWIGAVVYSGVDTSNPLDGLAWIADAAPSPFDFDIPAIDPGSPAIDWAVETIFYRAAVTIAPTASFGSSRWGSTTERIQLGDTNGPLAATIAQTNHTASGSADPTDVISARFRLRSAR